MLKIAAKRTNVTVDDRRAVFVLANARKPQAAVAVPHVAFIRNALKDRLNWPHKEPAPQVVLDIAREMAAGLVARDKAIADKKAANEAAAAQDMADAL
jgi:hypothetical protein